jgi:hypothetical protein
MSLARVFPKVEQPETAPGSDVSTVSAPERRPTFITANSGTTEGDSQRSSIVSDVSSLSASRRSSVSAKHTSSSISGQTEFLYENFITEFRANPPSKEKLIEICRDFIRGTFLRIKESIDEARKHNPKTSERIDKLGSMDVSVISQLNTIVHSVFEHNKLVDTLVLAVIEYNAGQSKHLEASEPSDALDMIYPRFKLVVNRTIKNNLRGKLRNVLSVLPVFSEIPGLEVLESLLDQDDIIEQFTDELEAVVKSVLDNPYVRAAFMVYNNMNSYTEVPFGGKRKKTMKKLLRGKRIISRKSR